MMPGAILDLVTTAGTTTLVDGAMMVATAPEIKAMVLPKAAADMVVVIPAATEAVPTEEVPWDKVVLPEAVAAR